jgi:predicted metal-dependent peptidase
MSDFATLEALAARVDYEQQAPQTVALARTRLLCSNDGGQVFLSHLAMQIGMEPCWDVEKTSCDGKTLRYNPEYVCRLDPKQLTGILCQSVFHCALHHITRGAGKQTKTWNLAADLAVNPMLLSCGLQLPHDEPLPGHGQYASFPQDATAETYYDLLQQQQSEFPDGCDGDHGNGSSGVDPSLVDGPDSSQSDMEARWDSKTEAAEKVAKQRGNTPNWLAQFCGDLRAAKIDWREQLRQLVSQYAKNDFSWVHPNRRFIWQGVYLPGLHSQELVDVVVAVDVSGSCVESLTEFASEIQGILESFDCTVTIMYHDTEVAGVQTWRTSDGPLEMKPVGGGGTDHRPVFSKVEELGLTPKVLVSLTDLYTYLPDDAPDYPVIWAVVDNPEAEAHFGDICHIDESNQ